ncbi:casparian strip membrane protein 1-like [Coffea arabica]|uniref:CASP-like protein n=1 Tax=Coffea arabica TaxID=13443 RepID=A0ABM4V108_COFAR
MPFKKKTKVSPEPEVDEESNESAPKAGANRGISKLDLAMRMVAAIGTLGSALAVGTANGSGPFFSGFFRFGAGYDDLPTFTFLVVTNAIVCGYLVLSLLLSIFHILKSSARVTRVILIILDTVMVAYLTGGASSAAAMVHLAHKGNGGAICQQHNSFCDRVAGALVGSFIGVVVLLLLISMSAVALSRH